MCITCLVNQYINKTQIDEENSIHLGGIGTVQASSIISRTLDDTDRGNVATLSCNTLPLPFLACKGLEPDLKPLNVLIFACQLDKQRASKFAPTRSVRGGTISAELCGDSDIWCAQRH